MKPGLAGLGEMGVNPRHTHPLGQTGLRQTKPVFVRIRVSPLLTPTNTRPLKAMKMKSIITAALASLVVIAGLVSAVHIRGLEARVKALENAQSLQLARTRVLIRALEQSESRPQLLDSVKLLVAVLEPDPQAAMSALRNAN